MLNYSQEFNERTGYITASHLLDAAMQLGLDTTCAMGMTEDMEESQLLAIGEMLKAEIEAELARIEAEKFAAEQRRRRPPCYIGPYGGGICLICGLRDPSCAE